MSFDSVSFWLFFAATWVAWRWLPFGWAKSFALVASLGFYAWWNPLYLVLIAVSAVTDFAVGRALGREQREVARRRLLLVSLGVNLGLLGFFKYAPFAVANAAGLGRLLGFAWHFELSDWVIPVGISFYTFQTLSYTIDVFRRRLQPCASFRDFFLFVTFFPQLVAGPIVRANELLPQLRRRRRLLGPSVQFGLYNIIVGLTLKIAIADNLAPIVWLTFNAPNLAAQSPASVWLGVIAFGGQIFADFAGYSGIAIGLAYLLGLRFPRNFTYPYIATGLSDFWRRWHITLSTWLRDYLYIPLGGNRFGVGRTYFSLSVTMLLGGLWHGASWTFVVWGAMHGLGLAAERALSGSGSSGARTGTRPSGPAAALARIPRMLLVFVFVHVAWVFFRAGSFERAAQILARMFAAPFSEGFGLESLPTWRWSALLLPIAALHGGQLLHEWFGLRKSAYRRALVAGTMLFLLLIVRRQAGVDFIYFQF